MHSEIFVNLPVKDLPRTRAFFEALGYAFDPRFTNEFAAGLILGEHHYAMLLTEPFFQGFTHKAIADAHTTTEVLVALSCASRAEVDALIAKAVAAGARLPRAPQDHGYMYAHAFEDLDGHVWEPFFMDAAAFEAAGAAAAAATDPAG